MINEADDTNILHGWRAQVRTHDDGDVTVDFAPQPVVDTAPVRLMGRTRVWVDPLFPGTPARLDVGDIATGAEALWSLLGEPGFAAVDAAVTAGVHGTSTAITVAASPEWEAVCRWGLVQWIRDFAPRHLDVPSELKSSHFFRSRLEAVLLDVDAATAASILAQSHVLDARARDELEEVWRRSARRLVTVAKAVEETRVPRGVVFALAEPLEQSARFLKGDPDPRFRHLADLDLRFRELKHAPGVGKTTTGDPWQDLVDLAEYDQWVRQEAESVSLALEFAAFELAGPMLLGGGLDVAERTSNSGAALDADRTGFAGNDFLLTPPGVLDPSETAITWNWWAARKTVSVEALADGQAVWDGRWSEDLAFRLVDSGTGRELTRGALVPDVEARRYVGTVTSDALVELPRKTDVDVLVLRAGASVPAPLRELARAARRARRDAARAITLTRSARLAHTSFAHSASKSTVVPLLESASEHWSAAADGFSIAEQPELFELCEGQARRVTDSATLTPLGHAERPLLAELIFPTDGTHPE